MSVARMSRPPALLVAAAALLAGGTLAAAPAQAVTCTTPDIVGLNVPGVDEISVDTSKLPTCIVTGRLKTHGFGAPDGHALFQVTLPPAAGWNHKFVQFGQ